MDWSSRPSSDSTEAALRSSADPGSIIRYTSEEWRALVRAIKAGEFELAGTG